MNKRNKLILSIVLSIFIGLIYIYPDIRFILELGSKFNGITLTATADESFYLARLNSVYEGDYRLANIGLYEHRNDLWVTPPYFEVTLGIIGKTLNIPVQYLDIICSFIFPVIIFWLIYLLIYNLSESAMLGIVGACSIILDYTLFSSKIEILKSILVDFNYSKPLWFLRPFSPQLIYIPFILSLLLIFKFIDSHNKWKIILIALIVTSLNYLHVYLWAFIYTGLAVWSLIAIFKKDFVMFKNIMLIFFISAVLSLPYWINQYYVTNSPNYSFLKILSGVEHSRRLLLPKSYLIMSMIVLYLNRHKEGKIFWFILTYLAAGLVCLNQQLITGMIVEPIHWSSYTNKTFLIIAFISSLKEIRLPKTFLNDFSINFAILLRRNIFYTVICLSLFIAFIQQHNYYYNSKKYYTELQLLSGAINWLNNHSSKEDVVLTDSIKFPSFVFVRSLLLYTHNFYYLSTDAQSLISLQEIENRILSVMRFFDYSKEEAEEVINYEKGQIFIGLSAQFSISEGFRTIDLDKYNFELKNKWSSLLTRDPLKLLKQYKVDFILLSKYDHLFSSIENKYANLIRVYEDSDYKILKI